MKRRLFRRRTARGLLSSTATVLPDETNAKRLERVYTERLGRWRDLLAEKPQTAREALRALMPSDRPILLTPDREGYLLRGSTKLGALLFDDAVSSGSAKMASPRGTPSFIYQLCRAISGVAVPLRSPLARRH